LERAKPGTGLGLYLVRTLVDRMKGRVRIRDGAQGSGTVFEVTLPGRMPAEEDRPVSPPTESAVVE
jgi:signal transduction histidine kinase